MAIGGAHVVDSLHNGESIGGSGLAGDGLYDVQLTRKERKLWSMKV